jgi:glutaminyl-tRNA synthetase
MINDKIKTAPNFIKNIIEEDLRSGKHQQIITRFPPEPNGYLHVGHAKAICINFGLASEFNGKCNLRFDDTNPEKENNEFVVSIQEDIKWLGFNWNDNVKYASDYFDKLYEFAIFFINNGLAYVCDLDANQMKQYRGTYTEDGVNSPNRNRSIAENLELFNNMKLGKYPDGSKTLRLKIDMSSPNINLRDPVIYRIKRAHHIRTGDKWCIYPMYDYTHCISDALESITHSCCSLEFEDHRPLYDWVVAHLYAAKLLPCHPQQIEFSRLELLYTVTSKRKLNQLVQKNVVTGWDDPRMPTISGMRRRGYTANGIKLFAQRCGVSKSPNIIDFEFLENAIREELENEAIRVMAVIKPLKITLINFDATTKSKAVPFHMQQPIHGERELTLTKEIYIEQSDFMEHPVENWQRLAPGKEIRLRHSYIIKCEEVVKNNANEIIELKCTLDPLTLGANPQGRKVKGVIHWVSSSLAVPVKLRMYDRLFNTAKPEDEINDFNHNSLLEVNALIEPEAIKVKPETRLQFERIGYFVADRYDSKPLAPVFNKTVDLKNSWMEKK